MPKLEEELMKNDQSLMTFPCDFQIKIIGHNTKSFALDINQIARKHFPSTMDEAICSKTSHGGNYLSISITVHVNDQPSLDALYLELTKHPDIKMVL